MTNNMSRLLRTLIPTMLLTGVLLVAGSSPGWAHHGWAEFDTTRPLYVAGEVVSVRWANPHPEIRIRVDAGQSVPADLASLPIPPELEEIGGRDVLRATRAYDAGRSELVLVLAPTNRLEAWGMPDEVRTGERLRAIGYMARDDAAEMRPELLIRSDGRTIRQRSVALPEPPTAAEPTNPADGTAAPVSPESRDPAPSDPARGGSDVLLIIGALAVPAVAIGLAVAVRRRRPASSS
jgi:hypothetical protein